MFWIGVTHRWVIDVIKRYHDARKRAHYLGIFITVAIEFTAIAMVHDPTVHYSLAGGVATWESLVTSIGEDVFLMTMFDVWFIIASLAMLAFVFMIAAMNGMFW